MEMARHVRSTQNKKLVAFLQNRKKKKIDKVYILHAEKRKNFLQVDVNILGLFGQT